MTAGISALAINYLEPEEHIGWHACWLLGVLVSITDTTEVLEILEEHHSPETFIHVVKGESLLNDGIGIILFKMVKELALPNNDHNDFTFKFGFKHIIYEAFGGFILGYFWNSFIAKWS